MSLVPVENFQKMVLILGASILWSLIWDFFLIGLLKISPLQMFKARCPGLCAKKNEKWKVWCFIWIWKWKTSLEIHLPHIISEECLPILLLPLIHTSQLEWVGNFTSSALQTKVSMQFWNSSYGILKCKEIKASLENPKYISFYTGKKKKKKSTLNKTSR